MYFAVEKKKKKIKKKKKKKKKSFGSFSHAVSEEKIFLEINHSKTRIACGSHVCYLIGSK
jgi:hypothetical protein